MFLEMYLSHKNTIIEKIKLVSPDLSPPTKISICTELELLSTPKKLVSPNLSLISHQTQILKLRNNILKG